MGGGIGGEAVLGGAVLGGTTVIQLTSIGLKEQMSCRTHVQSSPELNKTAVLQLKISQIVF